MKRLGKWLEIVDCRGYTARPWVAMEGNWLGIGLIWFAIWLKIKGG